MMHEEKEFSDFDDDHGHSHNHDHGHDHVHNEDCDHGSHHNQHAWRNGFDDDSHDHNEDYENEHENSLAQLGVEDLMNVVQLGTKGQLVHLLQQCRDLLHQRDAKGNSVMHWAAKRGSVDILQALVDLGAKYDSPILTEPNMLPIHWAAADGKIDSIEFLLSQGQDINAQDANGSSAAVIAAQYGQVNTIIYLSKHGAELTLTDSSGDHVLHWAAYKGDEEILQLMLYLYPRELNVADRFGQTALHLSSLKGHTTIVELLLKKYQADYTLRDKSGKTPLELSIEKKHHHMEWLIKRTTAKSTLEFYRKVLTEDRQFLLAAVFGSNDYEKSVWAWRVTFISNFYATVCLLQFTFNDKLADLYTLHTINTVFVLLWWILFLGCLWKDPGYIVGNAYKNATKGNEVNVKKYPFDIVQSGSDIEEARESLLPSDKENVLYEKGLNVIGKVESSSYTPVLCHTCHIERPLRSKHDRFVGKCIYKFDHFCPFVYNAVGRDNYRFFIGLLLFHPIAYVGFVLENIYYYYRTDSIPYLYYAFFIYSVGMCAMVIALGAYHFQLIQNNLTTNEHSNRQRYEYLQDELTKRYHNPFAMNKTFWANFLEVLLPSQKIYYTRQDAIRGEIINEPLCGTRV